MNVFQRLNATGLVAGIFLVLVTSPILASGGHGHADEAVHDEREDKGPHGGKLLHADEVTLELAIFERGVPPEYRAWISRDGKPVEDASLEVTLTRLGGKEDVFTFSRHEDYWRGDGVVAEPHSFDVSATLALDGERYQWQWASHEGRVEIDQEIADASGVTTALAGAQTIARHLRVYGQIVTPPDQLANLHARFPGVITDVRVNIGDRVKAGDVLSVIESNESLKRYSLRAPIDGVVQQRRANVGESTGNEALFVLVDDRSFWAELKIFPAQRQQVKVAQAVHIFHGDHEHETQVSSVTPAGNGLPYVIARTTVDNAWGDLAPGDMVTARIEVEKEQVPLAVDARALQDFRDWKVVFIKVGDVYEIRPLELGRTDGRWIEVLGGLNPGDEYVVENSYLIKADIEKSGASHDH